MLKLHSLYVDILLKVRRLINKVIIGQEQNRKHLTKDALFDIQSLANQLYCLRSITPDSYEQRKICFSENLCPNHLKKGIKQLFIVLTFFRLQHSLSFCSCPALLRFLFSQNCLGKF